MRRYITYMETIGKGALDEATAVSRVGRFQRKDFDCFVALPCGRRKVELVTWGAPVTFQTLIEPKDVF